MARYRLRQRGPPRGRVEGVGKVLSLMGDEAVGELHDAHRVGGHAVVADHALAYPYVPGAANPQHGKVPVRRMATALRRNGRAGAEPFPGLRVIQDCVRRVDGVLGRAVPLFGGPPMFHDLGPGLGVTIHRLAPQVRRVGSTVHAWDSRWLAVIEVIPAGAAGSWPLRGRAVP